MPVTPDDPSFPHGSAHGYVLGCRPAHPCPASPTCSEAKAVLQRRYRAANPGRQSENPDWPQTRMVQRRLAETVAAVGYEKIAARTGLTRTAIKQVEHHESIRLDPSLAEPLDHAWSFFVRGTDTLAPDFEHGKVTSYNRYSCRCQECRMVTMRRQAKQRAGIKTKWSIIAVPGLDRHVERLVAIAGQEPVARACGVSNSCIKSVSKGERVRGYVAEKLLACTPAQVAQAARLLPSARAHQQLRSMWALGYSLAWIAAQDDRLSYNKVIRLSENGWVAQDTARALAELAAVVGDTPAGPQHGIPAKSAAQCRSLARRAGFYPPAYYDADGTLDYRSVPDHPWRFVDARAELAVATAHLLSTGVHSHASIAAQTGQSDKTVQRLSAHLGLVYEDGSGVLDTATCAGVIRRIRDTWADMEAGTITPVTAALMIGCLRRPNQRHPDVQAWVREHAPIDRNHDGAQEAA